MKFIVERGALKDAVASVAVRTKGLSIPILSNVLIETVNGSSIRLTGNDLDSCGQVTVPAEVQAEGSTTIEGDRFSRLVAGLPTGSQIHFAFEDARARIKCGRSNYQFPVLPAGDFPASLEPTDPLEITLSAAQVGKLFKVPAPCINKTEARFYLKGIYLHHSADRLLACATDGHRLMLTRVPVKAPAFSGVIVPDSACAEIVKLADDHEAIRFQIAQNAISAEVNGHRFVSKLIDGTFPDYDRVIPPRANAPMTLDSAQFDAALARLDAARDPKKVSVTKLSWSEDVGEIVASLTSDFGVGEERVECDCPSSREAGDIGAQIEYLRSIIDATGGDTVRLHIAGPGEPIRIENPADDDIVAVCMPCRF